MDAKFHFQPTIIGLFAFAHVHDVVWISQGKSYFSAYLEMDHAHAWYTNMHFGFYHACSTMTFYKVWDVTRATKKMIPAASIRTMDDLTRLGMTV